MKEKREELRKELLDLRIKLELTKKERVESDPRVDDLKNQIHDIRKQYAREILQERDEENGKKI